MIHIFCKVEAGILRHLRVTGHAAEGKNYKLICAAVSCLTRTAAGILTGMNGVDALCLAPRPGELEISVTDFPIDVKGHLTGITDFLLKGLCDTVTDYPDSLKLNINNKEWYNGS